MTKRPETGRRILLIEDDPDFVYLVREILAFSREEDAAWEVSSAETLGGGLRMLAKTGADVVLLDLYLPDSVGCDTFVRLRREAPNVTCIILTTAQDEAMALEALRGGRRISLLSEISAPKPC